MKAQSRTVHSESPTRPDNLTSVGFHTTHWTLIMAAKGDGSAAHEALASLCSTYWYPLYAYVRRQGSTPHESEDLTQEFFHRFLERNALAGVQPTGKFRSFLLTCLKNFLANERERAHAQRRGGGQPLISLNSVEAETRYSLDPADDLTPEAVYERRWAFAVLEQTMAELRREHTTDDSKREFEELQGFLPGGESSASRADLAVR